MGLLHRIVIAFFLASLVLASGVSARAEVCRWNSEAGRVADQFEWYESGKLRGARLVNHQPELNYGYALEGSILFGCQKCSQYGQRISGRAFVELQKTPSSDYAQLLSPERVKALLMRWVGFGLPPEDFLLEAKGRAQSANVFDSKGRSAKFVAYRDGVAAPRQELFAVVTGRGCLSITMVVFSGPQQLEEKDAATFRSAFSLVSYTPKPPPQPYKVMIEQLKDRSILEILQVTEPQRP